MFQGSYRYHIDDKGRLKLPADFVHGLGPSFTLTRGFRGCLWLMPDAEWREMVQKLQSDQIVDQGALTLQRYFIGSAVTLSLDGQGRISVPSVLRQYAAVQHEVMIVGIGSRIEVWSAEKWDEYDQAISDELIEDFARRARL